MLRTTLLTLFALALTAQPLFAQLDITIIRKKSGGQVGGAVTKVEPTGITIKPQTRDAETIPSGDVEYVEWAGEPPELRSGRGNESKGKLDEALVDYGKALAATNANVKADAQFLQARVAAKLAQADAAKLDDAIAKLTAFRTANANSFRLYEALALLGDLHTRKGNFDEADTVLTALQAAPSADVKLGAKNAKARVLLAKGEIDASLAAFDAVATSAGDTPAEQARKYEALLGKADCLRQKKDYDQAIAALQNVVEQLGPNEPGIQAEAHLRQGDCFREMNRPKEARYAYLHVDILYPAQPDVHAQSLYHLVALFTAEGKPDRAAEKREELTRKYPNSEWAKKVAGG